MYNKMQKLTLAEEQMPLRKFFRPMSDLPQAVKDEIFAGPVDYRTVPDAQHFLDWLKPYGEYLEHENAYCMFPDGSGYISTYMRFPETLDVKKLFWYCHRG